MVYDQGIVYGNDLDVNKIDIFCNIITKMLMLTKGEEDMRLRGFTLVELAIVMTIIGLLIGGILKGQELLENGRTTTTIAQVKSYEAAITAFKDIYDGFPGDMSSAAQKLPGCNDNCTPFADAADNGKIDSIQDQDFNVTLPAADVDAESLLFWMHLLKANLISGVNDRSLTSTPTMAFGEDFPAAKIGGGFIALMPNNKRYPVMLTLNGSATVRQGALTPMRAEQIDRKLDDGFPSSGSIYEWMDFPCALEEETPQTYDTSRTDKGCILGIQIGG